MGFDFQAAVSAATAVVEKQGESGNATYKYPLIYPQVGGTLVVRPLFNPKSGQIVRLVQRHEKVACYRTYGIECPICKIQQQVKDMTGQDPFSRTSASKSRGICFAQFVSADYPVKKGGDNGTAIQPGEVILFMFPWSVYTQINTMIQAVAQSPTGMDQAFSHASSGMVIQVSVSKDFKYTTVNVPYMAVPTQMSDDDFVKMLDEMDSLADQVLPSQITEEVSKQVSEYTDALSRQYISPRVPNQAPYNPQMTQFNSAPPPPVASPNTSGYPPYSPTTNTTPPPPTYPGTSYAPAGTNMSAQPTPPPPNYAVPNTPVPPTTNVPTPGATPDCMGNHEDGSPKCICCPFEVQCMSAYPF